MAPTPVQSRKYLCQAPRPDQWETVTDAVLQRLGVQAVTVLQQTLKTMQAQHPLPVKGPGRKSNAEHAVHFYQHLLTVAQSRPATPADTSVRNTTAHAQSSATKRSQRAMSSSSSSKQRKPRASKSNRAAERRRQRRREEEEDSEDDGEEYLQGETDHEEIDHTARTGDQNDASAVCQVCTYPGKPMTAGLATSKSSSSQWLQHQQRTALLHCSTCRRPYHWACVRPTPTRKPNASWRCSFCILAENNKKNSRQRRAAAVGVRVMATTQRRALKKRKSNAAANQDGRRTADVAAAMDRENDDDRDESDEDAIPDPDATAALYPRGLPRFSLDFLNAVQPTTVTTAAAVSSKPATIDDDNNTAVAAVSDPARPNESKKPLAMQVEKDEKGDTTVSEPAMATATVSTASVAKPTPPVPLANQKDAHTKTIATATAETSSKPSSSLSVPPSTDAPIVAQKTPAAAATTTTATTTTTAAATKTSSSTIATSAPAPTTPLVAPVVGNAAANAVAQAQTDDSNKRGRTAVVPQTSKQADTIAAVKDTPTNATVAFQKTTTTSIHNGDDSLPPTPTTTKNTTDAVPPPTSATSSNNTSSRSKRERRPTTYYNPQDVPASKWQTDELKEWKLKLSERSSDSDSSSDRSSGDDDTSGRDHEDDSDSATDESPDDEEQDDDDDDNETVENDESENQDEMSQTKDDTDSATQAKSDSAAAEGISARKAALADGEAIWCNFCKDDPNVQICVFCACRVCFGKHQGEKLLLCDLCDDEYHTFCCGLESVPTSKKWYCPSCEQMTKEAETPKTSRRASTARSSKRRRESPSRSSSRTASPRRVRKPVLLDDSTLRTTRTEKKKTGTGRPRGRPRKHPIPDGNASATEVSSKTASQSGKKRGRPPSKAKSPAEPPRKRGRPPSAATLAKRAKAEADARKAAKVKSNAASKASNATKTMPKKVEVVVKPLIVQAATTPTVEAAPPARPVHVSRSGRTVRRGSFHDELAGGAQQLKSARSPPSPEHSSEDLVATAVPLDTKMPPKSTEAIVSSVSTAVVSNVQPATAEVIRPVAPIKPTKEAFTVPPVLDPLPKEAVAVAATAVVKPIPHVPTKDPKTAHVPTTTAVSTKAAAVTVAAAPTQQPPPQQQPSAPTKSSSDSGKNRAPRRKPGARECMQISRRFGVKVIPDKYVTILEDYCARGKVEHLIRMRERLDEHARFLESQLAGLEALIKEKGESDISVPLAPPSPTRHD